MAGASGDFGPDASVSDTPETQLDSLFGVSQNVGNAPVLLERGSRGAGPGPSREDFSPAQSDTLANVLSGFYGMDPDKRANMQQQLFAGGFYGSSYYSGKGKQPQLGAADDDSYAAFKRAVVQAARSGNTLSEQIDAGIAANQQLAGTDARQLDLVGGKVGGGQNYVIRLADPNQVTSLADNIAQAVLGRKATAAEHAKITGEIQKAQASSQSAVNNANEAQNQAVFNAQTNAEQAAAAARNSPPPAGEDVAGTITRVAQQLGVDPQLAIAIARQESGLNPGSQGDRDKAGNPTSFGLYQLHRGGELGSMTPQQAYDPETNARVALSVVAQVAKQHPDWSPGQIAAAAQRPADPKGYAASVNSLYGAGGNAGGQTHIVNVPNTYIPAVTTTVTEVDPQARAEAALRAGNPSEAGAHDLAGQYDVFTKLIKGVQ